MKQFIIAEVWMKSEADGGRRREIFAGYTPHLVVPPHATFLGVGVVDIEDAEGYKVVYPANTAKVLFALIYHPKVDYFALTIGAEFDIHEGPNVVGNGRVLARNEHDRIENYKN